MSLSVETYALAKKYTNDSLIGIGALKGAPCKVKSVRKEAGQNIVTLSWLDDLGNEHETKIYINDGTPIYTWEPNYPYEYGDLAIYESCFYRCITANSDPTFDDRKWNEIGSPDGNYDIVQRKSLLPARFTSADRKLYFCIEDNIFYLWNGTDWIAIEPNLISNTEINNLFVNQYTPTVLNKYLNYSGLKLFLEDLDNRFSPIHAFMFKNSVADIAHLPILNDTVLGDVYKITAGGSTTADFVEGQGHTLVNGECVAVVGVTVAGATEKKYCALGGTFDLQSDYLQYGISFPSNPVNGQAFLYTGVSTYEYNPVVNPTGRPDSQGWYEFDGLLYVPTTDTSVQAGKTYYTKDNIYRTGAVYEYNASTTSWVEKTDSAIELVPITASEIDDLFI